MDIARRPKRGEVLWLPTMKSPLLILLIALAAGCDSAVDVSFRGEPLLRLDGFVASADPTRVGTAEIALLWVRPRLSADPGRITVLDADADLPGELHLPIYLPPRPDLLTDGVALAHVLVYDHGTRDHFDRRALLGMATDRVIVYVSQAVQPGSKAAALLHDTPAAGYHIMKLSSVPVPAQRCLDQPYEPCPPTRAQVAPLAPAEKESVLITVPARRQEIEMPVLRLP
jgi:hypothetical protein